MGGAAIDAEGTALSDDTLKMCRKADAVLLGAVGGPKWDDPKAKVHPEDGLLALRKGLGLFANLRPVKVSPMLVDATNLKPEVVKGVDFIFVRELTGGLYFGRPKRQWQTSRGRRAVDSMAYSEQEIERIVRVGFELARRRRKKLISVDKANVLESSRLWRQVAMEVAEDYPDVALEHMLVDACSMRLIQNPTYFDVLVTEIPSAISLPTKPRCWPARWACCPRPAWPVCPGKAARIFGLYEPIHGSAPSRAGLNMANPIATILSVAMMLRYSLGWARKPGHREGGGRGTEAGLPHL